LFFGLHGEGKMKFKRISVNPDVCSGKLCIRDLRFPVYQIVDLVPAGNSFEKILADYPLLEEEDIKEALMPQL